MAVSAQRLILVSLLISIAEGRFLKLNASDDQLISDGIDGRESSVSSCRHQYGFLPCAENGAGYFFMIVVYQVLLIVGDMLIGSGSELLFYITGPEFGGILFRILRALPSMTLMILSGIFSDKEHAQSQVSVAAGVYAGITVFSLTVQWFASMVSARKSLKEESDEHRKTSHSNCFPIKEKLRKLIDNEMKVDKETCKTAGIMLLSLIPYVVLQLVYAFNTSSGKCIITFIALAVSSLSLISYFVYQIRNPWMQKRSYYSNFDIVQRGFMQHVERLGKLECEDGTLNIDLIKKFFKTADIDDDKCIGVEEMEKLVCKIFKAGMTDIDQHNAVNQVMNKFDNNRDKRISEEELIEGFKQWIHEAKHSASDNDFNPRKMFHKAFQLLKKKKESNSTKIDKIMSKILKQAEGQLMRSEALITHNGEPNIERIQSLFREFNTSGDGSLSATELKQLISKVKFGTYQMKDDDVIKEMLNFFNQDNNNAIDEKEFIEGVKGYLEKAMKAVNTSEWTRVIEEFDKIVWKEVVYNKQDFFKSVFQVLLGITMITFLAGPLIENILQLSNAINLSSSIISIFVVPFVMNARAAIAALLPASKKREDTASLTFSEIYGGVIMNNISGLITLLAIVYAKDLTWEFSTEVLTILVVCAVIGTQAFLCTTYRLWTCILPIILYLISLGFCLFFPGFL